MTDEEYERYLTGDFVSHEAQCLAYERERLDAVSGILPDFHDEAWATRREQDFEASEREYYEFLGEGR